MLSNAYFLAKIRFDTAENEPAKNLQNFRKMHFRKMHLKHVCVRSNLGAGGLRAPRRRGRGRARVDGHVRGGPRRAHAGGVRGRLLGARAPRLG